MQSVLAELLSHVEDFHDRQMLADLIRRHEVLRVRLLMGGNESRVAERDAKIAELESQLARERDLAEEWKKRYQHDRVTIDTIARAVAECRRVAEENERLKGHLARVLSDWEPATRVLFQEAG